MACILAVEWKGAVAARSCQLVKTLACQRWNTSKRQNLRMSGIWNQSRCLVCLFEGVSNKWRKVKGGADPRFMGLDTAD